MKKSYRARKLMMLVMALMMLCSLFGMSAAEENVTPLLVPDAVVSTDGNITLNKWAERIGPDEWKVTVTADVKAIEVEPPKLEVVFVLDTSLSMKECADEEEHKNIGTWQYHTHDDSCPDGCDKYMIQHRKNNSCHYWTSSYADVQITPNRLTVATQAAEQLISSLPNGTAVRRVSFASRAFVEPTFTSGIYAAGETYLMSGVDLALQQFSNSEKTKILVIVTDGAATDNRYSSTALSAFTGAGGMVFTVGFNHEDANLAGMVANGGAYYHAGNPGELTSAFNQIGKKISTMVVDPMGSTVNFDITGVETNNNLSHSGNTIYWRPTEGQNMVGRVVEYSYNVKLNDSADRSEGTHLDVPLNGTTTFRYGITTGTGENATTQMNKLNFPIPEATYAYSSVQVRWVDEEGKDMSQYGFSPTEAEKMISDYSSDTYKPEFKTDYTNITERIDIPDGDGVYYQYVGTEYKADEQLLSSVDGVDATKAAAYTVVHQYQKVVPGNLEIIKALPNANDTMLADRFTFSITGPETFAGTVSYTLNKEPMTGTVDEKNTLTIEGVKADDVIQLQYIPSGDYTVTETGADGNKLFYNVTYPEGNEGGKVTVKEGDNVSLTVTNKPTENVFFKEWLDSNNAEGKRPTPSQFASLLMPFKAQEDLPKAGTACTAADFEPKPDALVVVQDKWDGMDTSKSNVYRIVVLGLPELEEGYSYYIGEKAMDNYILQDSERVFSGQFTYKKDGKETKAFYNIHNDKDDNILNAIAGYRTDFGTPENPNVKKWDDNNNQYKTRPDSITLKIKCKENPVFFYEVTVKPDENDAWEWHASLDKYDPATGKPYTYYVEEVSVRGYTSQVSDVVVNEETGICFVDIENTLETVDVSVQKVWNDFDDLYACRPDTVSVQILQNEEPLQDIDGNDVVIELTEANGWAATVTGLPKYDAEGREAQYSVKEINLPAAYEAQDPTGDMIHGITLENVLKTVDVSVEKEWEHGTNIDLPKKIYVQLYADNISFGDPVELNNDNQWKHTWEQLPEYSPEGIEISYTVGEVDEKGERFVVLGYHQMISETGEHQFSILNTFIEPVSGQITATKTLNGAELKADQFTFELTGMDGAPMPEGSVDGVYTQKNDGNGNVTFPAIAYTSADMADAVDGKKIFTYTVREVVDTPVDGYSYDMEERTVTVTVTLNDNYVLVTDVNGGAVPQFINSYAPVLTSATVKKIWEDEENQDGKRPETLTVTLSDGTEVELNEGNSWESTIENLPMYKDGEKIVYTWAEGDMPEGYTLTKTNVNGTITTLTNSYTPELTSATVKKIWEDEENQDGKRPETLTVTLSDGTQVELNEGNSWTATVENLPKYADGEEIAYTWTEDEVPEGYTQTGTETKNNVTIITNSYTPELTSATVKKIWEDEENQDGKRPETLTVTLSDGTQVELNEGNSWESTIENLPMYKDGEKIVYTWAEGDMPEGYKLTKTDVNGTVTTLTNSYTPELTSATVKKIWEDEENQDGKRPDILTVTLSDGTQVELNEGNGWEATVENLPKYENGEKIAYTWTEDEVPEGYTQTGTETTNNVTIITNSYTPELIAVEVSKIWDDENDQDGLRPDSIIINLLADGEAIETITVTEGAGWTWSFTDLPKYKDQGTEIVYTITEDTVDGYKSEVNGFNVTNSYEPETISVEGSKTWEDNNDQDGLRPDSITINLLADGVEVAESSVTEGDGWKWSFTDLPKYRDQGTEIVYTITEDTVDGYKSEVNGFNVTNSYDPETITVEGAKTWDDNNDQDGLRPDSITINLLADGVEVAESSVTEADGWKWSFNDLPKYKDQGTEIVYTITEDTVDGYETKVDGFNVTNTHAPEQINLSGSKTWDDKDDQDGKRPSSINITLLADGQSVRGPIMVTAEDGWSWIFTNLPKYKDQGTEIIYTVAEDDVPGYSAIVEGMNVTNSFDPETTSVEGSKTWDDNNDQDGIRPDSIIINLLADGVEVAESSVTEADGWKWSFTDLPKYKEQGEEIVYTITEDTVDDYKSEVNGFDVTNSYDPETIEVSGSKTWNDNNDQDGLRPDSITIRLLADGEEVAVESVSEADGWAWSFTDLPKYKDQGTEIVYTITEDTVDGYETKVDGFNVTNTHAPEQIDLSGSKTWDDKDDQDGKRPSSISITLLADGQSVRGPIMVTAEDGWSWIFTDLPKYKEQGTEIIYTVAEDDVPGYSAIVEGMNVTNSFDPETTSVEGSKTWNDNNDQDGLRPDSITIRLLADGEEVAVESVSEADGWAWSFTDLPKYKDQGTEIVYTITEDTVDGYKSEVKGFNVTNSYDPETISIDGSKTWDDNNDQDGLRPDSITINLLADGEVIETITVTEADGWAWNFTDLPKYKDQGTEIVYTITEDTVDGYKSEVNGFDVTNTHEPETVEVTVTKIWNDHDNQGNSRPDHLTVVLLADGEETAMTATLNEANGWTETLTDLPKRMGGEEIAYSWDEVTVPAGYTISSRVMEGNKTTITNDYAAEGKVQFSGTKTLTGRDLEEGQFSFTLTDGEKTETVKNDKDGNFTFTEITYDETMLGDHTYTVTEVNDGKPGYTYDDTEYEIIVKVEDNGDGTLDVSYTVNGEENGAIIFENKYKANGSVEFGGTKTLTGRDLAAYEFSFELIAADGNYKGFTKNDADGSFEFAPIRYTQEDAGKTFNYTVTEVNDGKPGYTYDDAEYEIIVKVEDNGDGTLNVTYTVNGEENGAITFENEYKANGSVEFGGTKTLTGRDMAAYEFGFELIAADGNYKGFTKNDADGSYEFAPIRYTQEDAGKTFTYTVTEVNDGKPGYTYDDTEYEIIVTVADNGDGTLDVSYTVNGEENGAITFENEYKAEGKVQFSGTKTLTGRELEDKQFSFIMEDENGKRWTAQNDAEGKFSFEEIAYTEADAGNRYSYFIIEQNDEKPGYTYDDAEYIIDVTVADNGDGTLSVTYTVNGEENGAITFENEYAAEGKVQFSGTKTLTGRELEDKQFSFIMEDENGKRWTAQNDAEGKFSFEEIAYTEADAGNRYSYFIAEQNDEKPGYTYDDAEYIIDVTVADNGDGTLDVTYTVNGEENGAITFENEYKAEGKVQFSGTKTLTGRELEDKQFSFIMEDENGKRWTAQNDAEGKFSFEEIAYTEADAGNRYSYFIAEQNDEKPGYTYDDAEYIIDVTVADNGDGALDVSYTVNGEENGAITFENEYKAEGKVQFSGTKTLTGRELEDKQFSFIMEDENGKRWTAQNDAEGNFSFEEIAYTEADAGNRYSYFIAEQNDEKPGYTYDDAEYIIDVTVADNGDGTLSVTYTVNGEEDDEILFANEYTADATVTISGEKTVGGEAPEEDEVFTFQLKDADGKVLQEVENDGSSIPFEEIPYTLTDAGKTYTYTIQESTESNEQYLTDGSVYTVQVALTDKGDGTLSIDWTLEKDGEAAEKIAFDNTPLSHLDIEKTVIGRAGDQEKLFAFKVTLTDEEGKELKGPFPVEGANVTSIESGSYLHLKHGEKATVKCLPVGTKYLVEEDEYTAFETEAQNAEGEITEEGSKAEFVNTLKTVSFSVTKEWQGGDNGLITLTLYENGKKMEPQPTYTESDNVYSYTNLPQYTEEGKAIVYAAKEKYMDGYMTIYRNIAPYAQETDMIYNGGTIVNKAVTSFHVQKVWEGLAEGEEVPAITLTLYCNGEKLDKKTPTPNDKGWYIWHNLPLTYKGEAAEYTVVEEPVDGFTVSYGEAAEGEEEPSCARDYGTIVNRKIPKTGDDSRIGLWIGLSALSACAFILLMKKRKEA